MFKFKSVALALVATGSILGLASPTLAASRHDVTRMSSAPVTYGYGGDEATTRQPRCENVEQHYAHYPKASSIAKEGGTLVPADGALASQQAWQNELAIASSPVCR